MTPRRDEYTPTASSTPFDNSSNGFISDDVQAAIEEVITYDFPNFGFGRSGTVSKGAYLLSETVPSNITGRYVFLNSAIVKKVFISSKQSGTYKFGIYSHDGNEVNLTLLGTVVVSASVGGTFNVSWAVAIGKQLAFRVESDSTDAPKEVVAGLELSGIR